MALRSTSLGVKVKMISLRKFLTHSTHYSYITLHRYQLRIPYRYQYQLRIPYRYGFSTGTEIGAPTSKKQFCRRVKSGFACGPLACLPRRVYENQILPCGWCTLARKSDFHIRVLMSTACKNRNPEKKIKNVKNKKSKY